VDWLASFEQKFNAGAPDRSPAHMDLFGRANAFMWLHNMPGHSGAGAFSHENRNKPIRSERGDALMFLTFRS
jgi:hypothetical protein